MIKGPGLMSMRAFGCAAFALSIALGCQQPVVGERGAGAEASAGPKVVIDDAWLDLHGHVVATFAVTNRDLPLTMDEVSALEPRFTLASLAPHPVDGIPSWKSQLLTGAQVAPKLPLDAPGAPDPEILTSARQPGFEAPASLVDLGGGRYRHVFESALADFDGDETLRVGVWLEGAPAPTLDTSATHDFRPSGGPLDERETVLDRNCNTCHDGAMPRRHGNRTRVRLCLTCHTWQHADPDTIDPASLSTTAATDPNPLELGRLVHRLHRGKRLPTMYRSTSQAVPAPDFLTTTTLPLPYALHNLTPSVMPPLLGKKFSVIGPEGETVFGRVSLRMDVQGLTTVVQAVGNMYPRDYRDCEVCHADAPQADAVTSEISRRMCTGCHPDIWFGATPITDLSHLAHPGGPRDHDGACADCHVNPGATLYAPIAEAHVPPGESARASIPVIQVLRVEDLVPGGRPRITFRAWDRLGPIVPKLNAPDPAFDPDAAVTNRKLSLSISLAGMMTTDDPVAPEYLNRISAGGSRGPDPASISTVSESDEYVYAFTSTLPLTITGTWSIAFQASRTARLPHFNPVTHTFNWPYTGETVRENAKTVVIHVDTATGQWTPERPPAPAPRRKVVASEKCLSCHGRFEVHSGARNDVQYCLFCHHPRYADYSRRKKLPSAGGVDLGATSDGVEERSLQLRSLVHRIHTGRREGGSSLEGIWPYLIGSSYKEGLFPGDLAKCTNCHEGKSFLVESVPKNAMPTYANETGVHRHEGNSSTHAAECATPPTTWACLGCHSAGPTFWHVGQYISGQVETCGPCHEKGPLSVEVAHGLAPLAGGVKTTFAAIEAEVLVPRCATAACHSGNPPVYSPQLDAGAGYGAMVGAVSGQAPMNMVEPGAPERSYLVYKLRGDATSAGGTGLPMPTDGLLDAADIAAIEAWILNGAPND